MCTITSKEREGVREGERERERERERGGEGGGGISKGCIVNLNVTSTAHVPLMILSDVSRN